MSPTTDTDPSQTSNSPSDKFLYNVSWMEQTFRNRKHSESLLDPELQNGNLSRKDYDTLMGTLRVAPYYDLAGYAIVGLGTAFYTRFKVPTFTVGIAGYTGGKMLGSIMRLSRHQKGLSSIENVHGFSRAMDNTRLTGSAPESPPESLPESLPQPVVAPVSSTPLYHHHAQSRVGMKYALLRDALMGLVKPGRTFVKAGDPMPSTFRGSDRAAEQASFDAMLERERK
ncbi:hypothetical protein B0H13DRAFT_2668096 [Mycena leptocephala]|nr:hypothetical protein B0H13DRAFT_2668096 [Mycena leptocephala]